MKRAKLILTIAVGLLCNHASWSQCRTFVKNNCREAMAGYVPGESFNSAKLMPGDIAEAQMTFYSGQDYRLLVCGQSILGDISFKVSDLDGNVIFNNADQSMVDYFDFRVEGTQELKVNLEVPKQKDVTINPQGCVAILVGRKL